MAHDGDARAVLDAPDEAVASPGDHQIDVLVESEECRHLGASLDGLYVCAQDARF